MSETTTAHYNAAERELKELAEEADGDTIELLQAAAVARAIVFGCEEWGGQIEGWDNGTPTPAVLRRLADCLEQQPGKLHKQRAERLRTELAEAERLANEVQDRASVSLPKTETNLCDSENGNVPDCH